MEELNKVGDQLRKNCRLVAQNYADEDATELPTKSPTVSRFFRRVPLVSVTLSITAPLTDMVPYTRDISQAYIQSQTFLERDIYKRATKELGLPDGFVLNVMKPLYGIPEYVLRWYFTYITHNLETLKMCLTRADPCALTRRTNVNLYGMILL